MSLKSSPASMPARADGRRLLASAGVSAVGDGFSIVAFGLLAYRATHDPRMIAAVFLAERLPWLLGLRLARVVDRAPRPASLLVAADVGRAAVLAFTALAITLRGPSVPLLVIAGALLGVGTLVHTAARSSLLPVLGRGSDLARLNGYLCSFEGLGYAVVGPALGGLVFAFGPATPLALDAASFLVSAAVIAPLRHTRVVDRARSAPPGSRPGLLRRVVADRILRLLLVQAVTLGLAQSMVLAVMPLFIQGSLGVRGVGYGLFLAIAATGGIATGFLTPHLWEDRRNTFALVIGAGIAAGLAYVAMASQRWPVAAVAMLFAFDGTVGITNTVAPTLRFERAPHEAQGATATLFRQGILGVQPLGAIASAALARTFGVRTSITVAGLLAIGCFALSAVPFRRAIGAAGA